MSETCNPVSYTHLDVYKRQAQGLLLSVASWLVFLLFGIFFSRMFIAAFTNIPEIIEMGTEYVSICTIFSFGVFVQVAFERIMQSRCV